MVDSVSSLARAIGQLRLAVATQASTRSGVGQAKPRSTVQAPAQGAEQPRTHTKLGALPGQVAALVGDAATRRRKALRLFLEALLLDEFGEENVLAPEFHALVEKTASAIEDDDELAGLLNEAMAELLVNPDF